MQAKLDAGEPVRIAEVGCGEGLAAITIAHAYPNAEIDGFDLDEASIAVASEHAAAAGVGDRVRFEVRDAADPTIAGDYDLVHGDRDAPRRARSGRDPADDAAARR